MRASVKVLLTWTEGKRDHLPQSLTYITVAKFLEDSPQWPEEGWSIVIDFDSHESMHAIPSRATARFLMPNAPWERLRPGREFEMYEGNEKTADVVVLP